MAGEHSSQALLRTPPVITPRLRKLLHLVFWLIALLALNSLYLAALTLAEHLTGEVYQDYFYLSMFLAHLVLGLALIVPFLLFGINHLRRARQRSNRNAVRAGMGLFAAGLTVLLSGILLTRFGSFRGQRSASAHAPPIGCMSRRRLWRFGYSSCIGWPVGQFAGAWARLGRVYVSALPRSCWVGTTGVWQRSGPGRTGLCDHPSANAGRCALACGALHDRPVLRRVPSGRRRRLAHEFASPEFVQQPFLQLQRAGDAAGSRWRPGARWRRRSSAPGATTSCRCVSGRFDDPRLRYRRRSDRPCRPDLHQLSCHQPGQQCAGQCGL